MVKDETLGVSYFGGFSFLPLNTWWPFDVSSFSESIEAFFQNFKSFRA